MFHKVENYCRTTLANQLNDVDTQIQVSATAASSRFPDVPFWITIGQEILEVTAKDGFVWTVTRGIEGQVSNYSIGETVDLRIIAQTIEEIQNYPWAPINHDHDDLYSLILHGHEQYAEEIHQHDTIDINTTDTHQFASETEKNTWNSKQDPFGYTLEDSANKGVPSGYAPLNGVSQVPCSMFHDLALQRTYIVLDETARLGLTGLRSGDRVYERSTTDLYIWDGDVFYTLSAAAVPGIDLSWNDVTGRPTSTQAQIDTAVDASHTHTNKALLDGIVSNDIILWDDAYMHISDLENPHGVTKSQVGLSNVQNYGIATQQEAEAGTNNTTYMTPERTSQAIGNLQSVTSVNTQTGDVTLTPEDVNAEPAIMDKTDAFNVDFGAGNNQAAEGNHEHDYVTSFDPNVADAEPTIDPKNTAFNKNFGTEADTVARGDHEHESYTPIWNLASFEAEAGSSSVTLKWQDPNDVVVNGTTLAEWAGTKIVRRDDRFPLNETDGTLVVDNTVRNQYVGGYTDSGLTPETAYYYKAFPRTTDGLVTVQGDNRLQVVTAEDPFANLPGSSEPTYEYDYGDYIETVTFGTFSKDSNNDGTFDTELALPTMPWRKATDNGNIYSFDNNTDGEFLDVGLDSNRLSITDTSTDPLNRLQWLKFYKKHDLMGGIGQDHDTGRDLTGKADSFIYICDRTLVNMISWDDLNLGDWIYGKQITIDGINYICRAVTGGNLNANGVWDQGALPETNEWDALMVKAHESGVPIWTRGTTEVGDAYGGGAWGQEIWSTDSSRRVWRGRNSPVHVNSTEATTRLNTYGWRPALVPVP